MAQGTWELEGPFIILFQFQQIRANACPEPGGAENTEAGAVGVGTEVAALSGSRFPGTRRGVVSML